MTARCHSARTVRDSLQLMETLRGIVLLIHLIGFATLFGAWEGGLIGVEKENKKLARFHDDIEAGRFLILIYARRDQESVVRHMMSRRHPEAEFAGIDSHFVNPFTTVRRRRAQGDRVRA